MPDSAENRGPLLNIMNWIFLVITCISCLLKILSKWIMVRQIQQDDIYMAAAMFGTVGYGVALSYQVSAGLGRGEESPETEDSARFQQAAFTAQIFYIFSLCLAKIAILVFMFNFALQKSRRLAVHTIIIFSIAWVLIAIFAVAFQCKLPQSWAVHSDRCFNQGAFWNYIGVTDIVVDIATAILPIYLLYDLQMRRSRKVPIMTVFASRILLIPIIVTRLVFINKAKDSHGHFADNFNIAVLTIVHTNLNVIVTCLPFIKPVTDNLQAGILARNVYGDTYLQIAPLIP